MQVTLFTVPLEAYPRYKYTRTHAVPLIDRFSNIMTKCGLRDPYLKPHFKDVDIYVIEDGTKDFVTASDLSEKLTDKIARVPTRDWKPDELSRQTESNKASIFIASYTKNQKGDQKALEVNGDFILLFDSDVEVDTPDLAMERIVLSVKKSSLFENIGLLLERIVLREFRERIDVLTAFMDIDITSVFANIDSDIKSVCGPRRFSDSRVKTEDNPEDAIGMTTKYFKTRKDNIERRINKYFKRDLMEIRKQLLVITDINSVDPLTICDAIHTSVRSDNPDSSEAQSVSELRPTVIRLMEFSKIKQQTEELESRLTKTLKLLEDNQETVEHLRGEMIGMFKRSKVPGRERPNATFPVLKKEVAERFLSINGVVGCGYSYTTLDIFFRKNLTDIERIESEEHTRLVINENGIQNYKLQTEEEFTNYCGGVGSRISNQNDRGASIGGFALKSNTQDLCLLTARHFALPGTNVHLEQENGERRHIGEFLIPQDIVQYPPDIAVAVILRQVRDQIQKQFKKSDGERSPSYIVQFAENELGALLGLPVHMWGAASKPGLGVITHPDYYIEGMSRLVKVMDRAQDDNNNNVDRFANLGDSGAIICADDPDGKEVQVLSMLMGGPVVPAAGNVRQTYTGLRMIDGLAVLNQEHQTNFTLC